MSIVASTEGFVQKHPMAAVGVAVGVVLLLWWVSSGSSAQPVQQAYNPTADAAQIAQAQIAGNTAAQIASIQSNAGVAAAQIAAGVQNQASSDQLAATIAQFNMLTASQASHDAATVATANAATEQVRIQEASATTQNYNNNVASEFATLASTVLAYGQNAQNITGKIQSQQIDAQSKYDLAKMNNQYSPNTLWYNFGQLGNIGTNAFAKLFGVSTTSPEPPPGSSVATTPAVAGGNPANYESAATTGLLNRLVDRVGLLQPTAPTSTSSTVTGSGTAQTAGA